ncbi:DUF4269 domain-containing protein [Leptolyngbyaceae cyanobacterium CCMR0081]|uniref:DUF4269 domain-containing protein n=2 Tax=Adonisia TaxID=2950183 RepID=A0A6M0RN56_9CYAN|nr:DUF4269 domain-containing protein [Adonisia turfae]NEZ57725.1 DUF4269 domain-containing protein [Adonisia turfae CCMR0081]
MRSDFVSVLEELDLMARLQAFQPFVIGTPPLGIAISSSDIDIACYAPDLDHFIASVTAKFGNLSGFKTKAISAQGKPAVCAVFQSHGWQIELFCQSVPTSQQWGVKHFLIERRLLETEPRLKSVVKKLKQDGMKTEPAFAFALGLEGDPYKALLALEIKTDAEISDLVSFKADAIKA